MKRGVSALVCAYTSISKMRREFGMMPHAGKPPLP